eukprot:GEMP01034107.1.p1 GENE.GEMP01034107.1~~GEMP01034107.1.p1  ORF type:complete len:505 (-),score=45.02 GEMP01034107.1:63-1577(-)
MASSSNVSAIIDDVPVGRYHYRLIGLLAGGFAVDAAQVLMITSTVDAVLPDLHVNPNVNKGIAVSMLFIGTIVGNLFGGLLSDAYGRRPMVIVGLGGLIISAVMEAQAQTLSFLLVTRFLFGIAMGITVTTQNSLILEMSPSDSRATISAVLQCSFAIGEIYTASLLVAYMPDLKAPHGEWRTIATLICVPALICLPLCLRYLDETPVHLMINGKHLDAIDVLTDAAEFNDAPIAESLRFSKGDGSIPGSSVDFVRLLAQPDEEDTDAQRTTWKQRLSICFTDELFMLTCGGMYCCFLCNFNVIGLMYLQPHIVSQFMTLRPAQTFLVSAFCTLPASGIAIYLVSTKFPFNCLIGCMFIISTVSTLVMAVPSFYVMFPAVCVSKCAAGIAFVLFYIYVAEDFPSIVRATGSGLVLSAVLTKKAGLQELHGQRIFIGIMAALFLSGAILMKHMPPGRKQLQLLHRPSSHIDRSSAVSSLSGSIASKRETRRSVHTTKSGSETAEL